MMNLFEDAIDRTDLVWTLSRDSSGTAGSYLKSYEIVEGRKIYYKMSRYDSSKTRGIRVMTPMDRLMIRENRIMQQGV